MTISMLLIGLFFCPQARKEAEARLQEEEIRRAADEKRLQDIQELNEQLEKLYSEEKQARRDEEIVRALSARQVSSLHITWIGLSYD